MKKLSTMIFGVVILSTALSSSIMPALALGGCGSNHHRSSVTGRCIWGGQNQRWCENHTGHAAVRGSNGTWVCVR